MTALRILTDILSSSPNISFILFIYFILFVYLFLEMKHLKEGQKELKEEIRKDIRELRNSIDTKIIKTIIFKDEKN